MEIDIVNIEGIAIVTIKGNLVMETAPKMRMIAKSVLSGEYNKIALDLTELGILTSIGLNEILEFYRATKNGEKKFCVFNPSAHIIDIFKTTSLFSLFTYYRSREEMLKEF